MKNIVIASLIALAFTTGFTCSKNQPAENAAPTQEQMAAPAEAAPADAAAAPAEGAAPTEMAPAEGAAPAEGSN
ncbi:MAG: acylneuraminate cytidylyltransferase [Bdellovibrionales bacterium]